MREVADNVAHHRPEIGRSNHHVVDPIVNMRKVARRIFRCSANLRVVIADKLKIGNRDLVLADSRSDEMPKIFVATREYVNGSINHRSSHPPK